MTLDPLVILLLGLITVIGLIVFLRMNAFLALLAAAMVVSFCTPSGDESSFGQWSTKVNTVAHAFGEMAGRIGILLAFGAIIGKCMSDSGAADRIIERISRFFGPKRLPAALLGSGFVLSIPVFYDVTFYLLLPLAKSVYRTTRRHYMLYLLAIGFGATLSHTLVPPTPGPLLVAETFKIPLATMLFFGLMTGICLTPFAFAIACFIDWYMPEPQIAPGTFEEIPSSELSSEQNHDSLPSFGLSILPILLPVLLIAAGSIVAAFLTDGTASKGVENTLCKLILVLANPHIALMLGALAAVCGLYRTKKMTLRQLETTLEQAILSAGMIIMITSAGGAFGTMLRLSGVGPRIAELTSGTGSISGTLTLVLAFATAAMIKTAQGSSTTAMITVSAIFAAMNLTQTELGFHPGYLAVTIGLGACVTGWMNDSGFCIFSRMSGISETDSLKTWTVGLALLGLSGLIVVLILSSVFPFA